MERWLTTLAWCVATLAVVALASLPFVDADARLVAGVSALAVGALSLAAAGLVHRVRAGYLIVLGAMGVHLIVAVVARDRDEFAAPTSARAVGDLVLQVALVLAMAAAAHTRRGGSSRRDAVDALSVAVAGAVVGWITIADPLLTSGASPATTAVLTGTAVPVAVLLACVTVALLISGLHRNPAMRLLSAAVVVDLAAVLTTGIVRTGDVDERAAAIAVAAHVGAFLLAASAFVHPSVHELVTPKRDVRPVSSRVRLALSTTAMLVPVALLAAIPGQSPYDRVVRTIAAVALIGSAAARLFHAVRENDATQHELLRRIHTDDLTGLANRRQLVTEVDGVLDRTWRSEQRPVLMLVDLDRFKNLKDSLGHDTANRLLRSLATRLSSWSGGIGGSVARTGLDEFVVLDPGVTSSAQALTRAEAVRAALSAPFYVDEVSVFITASIGVVVAPKNQTIDSEEFLRRAGIATHRAKSNGRNCIALFDDSMQRNLTHRMDVENALYGAIERREMRLYYQPIVEIGTGSINGFESLIRWQRADGTMMAPSEFVPIAEETGLINTLGAWALLEGLTELRRWIDDGIVTSTTTMSVNVSPRQVADPHFPDVVGEALTRAGVPPHLLWLEMTESMMLSEPEVARATLRRIRSMGVRVALDDFGTGYSSLSLLQRFPLQRIKIDRAFVQGVAERGNDRSLVRTIIAMGASLGLDVVAEGVETVHQLITLRELGCAKVQGYLISHPIPSGALSSTVSALKDLGNLPFFGSSDVVGSAFATAPSSSLPSGSSRPVSVQADSGAGSPLPVRQRRA
jgi:diguanylate cyclase (GGDEF)-like protein